MGEKKRDGDPYLEERSGETEPHDAEFVPHPRSDERRTKVDFDPAGHDPGEDDPEMSDTLDEALAAVLPEDDDMKVADLPLSDLAEEDTAFPLVDTDPGDLPDDEVGDVDDEERLEEQAEEDDPVIFGRVK